MDLVQAEVMEKHLEAVSIVENLVRFWF